MLKSGLAALTVVALLGLGSAEALAQSYTKAPPPAPVSAAHQQALLNGIPDPDACIKAVDKAAGTIGFRIQGGDGMNGRMYLLGMYEAARSSARAGDNDACWHFYDRAMNRP
jgi:hypothetical protein